jgi:predicted DsbA family dithiol-disulfide isomerase
MKKLIDIKIASDVVCPWCYIGKKNLTKAIDQLKDQFDFHIHYLPFELAPDMPPEGEDFREHITKKYGDWELFIRRARMVEEIGIETGIQFQIEKLGPTPNTFQLHRIIQFSHQLGLQHRITEALFKAYFEDLIDLTKIENVINVVKAAGLDEDHVRILLSGNEGVEEIRALQHNVRSMGITGVPYFIIDNRYGISGAVSVDYLKEAISRAAEEIEVVANNGDSCSVDGCD